MRKNGKGDNGWKSNNNNKQQKQQQRAAGTKYNVFVLKATTAKTLLPVCECVCVRTTDTIRAQLSALMSEAMETVVIYVCVYASSPPCVPYHPACRCAFFYDKRQQHHVITMIRITHPDTVLHTHTHPYWQRYNVSDKNENYFRMMIK